MTSRFKPVNARDLIQAFTKLYNDQVSERYAPSFGRDGKIFKNLLDVFTGVELLGCLHIYFIKPQRVYSVPFFKTQVNELYEEYKATKKEKLVNKEASRFGY